MLRRVAMTANDVGSKLFWNVGQGLPDYSVYPRQHIFTYLLFAFTVDLVHLGWDKQVEPIPVSVPKKNTLWMFMIHIKIEIEVWYFHI
jgi:hypothetical protein